MNIKDTRTRDIISVTLVLSKHHHLGALYNTTIQQMIHLVRQYQTCLQEYISRPILYTRISTTQRIVWHRGMVHLTRELSLEVVTREPLTINITHAMRIKMHPSLQCLTPQATYLSIITTLPRLCCLSLILN
uniref:Uncharacterized protein n=1 Tax=Cacopsylla melanoneura TaxID=428564 RepID=A0A8D8X1W9_9HEMI